VKLFAYAVAIYRPLFRYSTQRDILCYVWSSSPAIWLLSDLILSLYNIWEIYFQEHPNVIPYFPISRHEWNFRVISSPKFFVRFCKVASSIPDEVIDFFNLSSLSIHQVFSDSRNEYQESFLRLKRCRRLNLTTQPSSISRLSRKYEILDILKPYRPPRPVTGIVLHYFTNHTYCGLCVSSPNASGGSAVQIMRRFHCIASSHPSRHSPYPSVIAPYDSSCYPWVT
jgi:hypothetical protein